MGRKSKRPSSRRKFLATTSGTLAATLLAGCSGDDGSEGNGNGNENGNGNGNGNSDENGNGNGNIPQDSELFYAQTVAPVMFDPVDPQVVAEQKCTT